MSGRYYHGPAASYGRSDVVDRVRVDDKDLDRILRQEASDHSDTPSLSRASTPSSVSQPPTPTLTPSLPTDSKMRGRHVEFASPLSHSYRRPEYDELSVMRAFASHTTHCGSCSGSLNDHHRGGRLCDRGTGLAKDLGTYFYCYDGKPHSNLDKRRGREKVQVEVPSEYRAVKGLFSALDGGLDLRRSKSYKPEVQQPSSYSTSRPSSSRRYTPDAYPTSSRRHYLDREDYDLRPSRSDSRRCKDPVYKNYGGRYVDDHSSSPYYQYSSDRRRSGTPPTPTTPRTPLSKYYSGSPDSDYRRYEDAYKKRASRRDDSDRDRYRYGHDDKYSSKLSSRRDSYYDRYDKRYDDDRRRRDSKRPYSTDEDKYRRSRPSSSYYPSSSIWR